MSRTRRRFPWTVYAILLVLILALALAPVVSVIVAGGIADAHGCKLDEGSVHPCLVNGADWGENLYTFAMLGWLMLASLPLGFIGIVLLAVVLLVHRSVWSRAQKQPPP